jgi:hypothetical protein
MVEELLEGKRSVKPIAGLGQGGFCSALSIDENNDIVDD